MKQTKGERLKEKAEKTAYFKEKDRIFDERKKNNNWPADDCENCKRDRFCCQRYGHHLGDNCLHCGNDERGLIK